MTSYRVAETYKGKVEPLSSLGGGGVLGVCYSFQIDQNAAENFNLTSDGEFNAIKSLVLGKVHGKETGSGFLMHTFTDSQSKRVWLLQNLAEFNAAARERGGTYSGSVLSTLTVNWHPAVI